MTRLSLVALACLWIAPAAAQQAGGLSVAGPGMGQMPLQPDMSMGGPLRQTPADVQSANPARARQAADQSAIAAIRGDGGFLGGFFRGQALASSRQPPPEFAVPEFLTLFTVNNFGGPVSVDASGAGTPVINNQDSAVAVNTGSGAITQQNQNNVNIAAGQGNVAQQVVK